MLRGTDFLLLCIVFVSTFSAHQSVSAQETPRGNSRGNAQGTLSSRITQNSSNIRAGEEVPPAIPGDSTLSDIDREIIAVLRTRPIRWFAGIALVNSAPSGEFRQVMDSIGKSTFWGFQLHGGYSFEPLPLAVGMNMDFLFAGSSTRTWVRGSFPFRTFDTVRVTNLILPISVFARVQPVLTPTAGWSIKPYFEGFAGLTVLTSTISFITDSPTSRQNSSDNDAAAPLHYGVSAGIQIQLAESLVLPTQRTLVMLDIRGRYMAGASTDYRLVSWNDAINAPQSSYLRSTTGMMLWSAGVTVSF